MVQKRKEWIRLHYPGDVCKKCYSGIYRELNIEDDFMVKCVVIVVVLK